MPVAPCYVHNAKQQNDRGSVARQVGAQGNAREGGAGVTQEQSSTTVAWPAVRVASRVRRSRFSALAYRCTCKSAIATVCAGTRSEKVNGGLPEAR